MHNFSRRFIVKGLGATVVSTVVGTSFIQAEHMEKQDEINNKSYDTIVIGGGIAGLVTAREIGRLGHKVLILEGTDNIGGLLRKNSDKDDFFVNYQQKNIINEIERYSIDVEKSGYYEIEMAHENFKINQGLKTLINSILDDSKANVKTSCPVTNILKAREGYTINTLDASFETISIVLALPESALRNIEFSEIPQTGNAPSENTPGMEFAGAHRSVNWRFTIEGGIETGLMAGENIKRFLA